MIFISDGTQFADVICVQTLTRFILPMEKKALTRRKKHTIFLRKH